MAWFWLIIQQWSLLSSNIQSSGSHHFTCIWSLHYGDVVMGTVASHITRLTIVYSTVYSGVDQRNFKAPRHWNYAANSPGTGEFPAQMASNAENVSIWWRHHYSWSFLGRGDCLKNISLSSLECTVRIYLKDIWIWHLVIYPMTMSIQPFQSTSFQVCASVCLYKVNT